MRKDLECLYFDRDRGVPVEDREQTYHKVYSEKEVREVRRGRVTCPECGRRMMGWVAIGYDDNLRCIVPRHRKKAWWKK